jgi:quercetin dioxygenase-like cupin family protein
MAIQHLASGEMINVLPLGDKLAQTPTTAFFKDAHLEVLRLVLPTGRHIPGHAVDGPITIQGIEGEVSVDMAGTKKIVRPGDLLYIAAGIRYELLAIQNSSLLVTIALPHSPGYAQTLE